MNKEQKEGVIRNLEDLKSDSGNPFEEIERTDEFSCRTAKTSQGEFAYFCETCGWIKGMPNEKKYDDREDLAGSAGMNYFCTECKELIGTAQFGFSLA